MLKLAMLSVLAIGMAAIPAQAMCCGDKDKAASANSKMQCMKMDMDRTGQKPTGEQPDAKEPHAGMDMGKDGTMDHSKMSGCGCCGEKKSG